MADNIRVQKKPHAAKATGGNSEGNGNEVGVLREYLGSLDQG